MTCLKYRVKCGSKERGRDREWEERGVDAMGVYRGRNEIGRKGGRKAS